MSEVLLINRSQPDVGIYTRKATLGDEQKLVTEFIDYYCTMFLRNNKINNLAVFVEPRIDSGFPDIVFATYKPSILKNWSKKRDSLCSTDLKLLSYLNTEDKLTTNDIVLQLGFSKKQTLFSLESLMNANLINYKGQSWRARKLHDIFSITKLVAIEAKINDMNRVMEQTRMNTRFASHSYALTNSMRPHKKTLERFRSFGLGLYGKKSGFHSLVEARHMALPSSYLSFQFNEWIGRIVADTCQRGYKNV